MTPHPGNFLNMLLADAYSTSLVAKLIMLSFLTQMVLFKAHLHVQSNIKTCLWQLLDCNLQKTLLQGSLTQDCCEHVLQRLKNCWNAAASMPMQAMAANGELPMPPNMPHLASLMAAQAKSNNSYAGLDSWSPPSNRLVSSKVANVTCTFSSWNAITHYLDGRNANISI